MNRNPVLNRQRLHGNFFLLLLICNLALIKGANGAKYPKGFEPQDNQKISFRENLGQVCDQNLKLRPDVLFSGTDGKLVYHLKKNGISYQLEKSPFSGERAKKENLIYRIDVNWPNSNTSPLIKKSEPLYAYDNFYTSQFPKGLINVKSYKEITYLQIYKGIDLKWYEKEGVLTYDYIISAHADYRQIQLELTGAEKITINSKGQLVIQTPFGDIIEQAPIVEQNGKPIPSKWVMKNNLITFDIKGINPDQPFVIDPAIRAWGTYYGGEGEIVQRFGHTCATDKTNNVYISGFTASSLGIATVGSAQQSISGTYNAFLAKFNAAGVRQWGTYYGQGDEHTGYCTTDKSGNVYLAGSTIDPKGMAAGGIAGDVHQPVYGGGNDDAWMAKFDAAGILQWATYYGGKEIDLGFSCVTDTFNNVYLSGTTKSEDAIATPGSHQPVGGGKDDVFLVKFNAAGVRQWATYYGGDGEEVYPSISSDAWGNVYMSGYTTSTTGTVIATPGSYQPTFGGGEVDAFLVKFNADGIRQWATYYGGEGIDSSYSCITDASGDVYLAGTTNSANSISSTGSHQSNSGGDYDAFLAKFDSSGIRQWATYYGGEGTEGGYSCATDTSNNVYLTGLTASKTGTSIATVGSHQPLFGGGTADAFLAKFNSSGIRQWATYYGGEGAEAGHACVTEPSGSVYMSGQTGSKTGTSIATTGSHKATYGGGAEYMYLVKFEDCMNPVTASITAHNDASCGSNDGAATAQISGGGGNLTYIWLPSGGSGTSVNNLPAGTYTLTVASGVCMDTATVLIRNGVNNLTADAGLPATICPDAGISLGENGDTSYAYSWQPTTGLSCSNCSNPVATPDASVTYRLIVTDGTGCSDTDFVAVTVLPFPIVFAGNDITLTIGDSVTITAIGNGTFTWSTGETTLAITVFPLSTTAYYLTVTDTNKCTSIDSVTLFVNIPCSEIFVPSAFSPNKDGINDILYVRINCVDRLDFRIYDRWGNNVFESLNVSDGWNGTFEEKLMNPAVFAYFLEARLTTGNVISKKGYISLIR